MERVDGPRVDRLSSVSADGGRVAIHPSDVKGRFMTARRIVFFVLIALYVAFPLVKVGGHPMIHLDIAARRFYLFGGTYNAQDFWIALFLLTTVGFGLLFLTAWKGRVWCGWACPQTVFLEGVYRPIERLIDGPRERRLKTEHGPWTFSRVWRGTVKHGAYLLVSFMLAHVFLSLFTSAPGLLSAMVEGPAQHEMAFGWAMGVTGVLYFNYAWFREQLCIIVCPYGRLQSAMTDRDSLIVGYDAKRGDPRGRLIKAVNERAAAKALAEQQAALGDCVDCNKCVTACPTGIDIRNGLQLECIACAQCIDACDEVMDKIGRPRGLIRYDSLAGLAGEPKRVARGRLFGYGGLLAVSVVALVLFLGTRRPFEANLLRAAGIPYALDGQQVRNQFELHLVNKNPGPSTFDIKVLEANGAQVILPQGHVTLGSLENLRMPIFLTVDRASFHGPFPLKVEVLDSASGKRKLIDARFLGPQG